MANLKDMDFAVQLTNEACLLGEPDYLVRLDENKAVANYRSFFNRDEAVFKNGKISNHKVFFVEFFHKISVLYQRNHSNRRVDRQR